MFRVGLASFGGPVAQIGGMHRVAVEERNWLSDGQFVHLLDFAHVLSGPEALEIAIHPGYLKRGVRGRVAAGVLFVWPGLVRSPCSRGCTSSTAACAGRGATGCGQWRWPFSRSPRCGCRQGAVGRRGLGLRARHLRGEPRRRAVFVDRRGGGARLGAAGRAPASRARTRGPVAGLVLGSLVLGGLLASPGAVPGAAPGRVGRMCRRSPGPGWRTWRSSTPGWRSSPSGGLGVAAVPAGAGAGRARMGRRRPAARRAGARADDAGTADVRRRLRERPRRGTARGSSSAASSCLCRASCCCCWAATSSRSSGGLPRPPGAGACRPAPRG